MGLIIQAVANGFKSCRPWQMGLTMQAVANGFNHAGCG
jgi:hypothetical protein